MRPQVFKDKATNVITPGDAVWFDAVGGVTEVVDIVAPSRGPDGSNRPGILKLQVEIPFEKKEQPSNPQEDDGADTYVFGFVLYTRNPRKDAKVEKQVEDILSGKIKPAATLTLVPKKGK